MTHLTVVPETEKELNSDIDDPDPVQNPADDANVQEFWSKRHRNPDSHLLLLHTSKLLQESRVVRPQEQDQKVRPEETKISKEQGNDLWRTTLSQENVQLIDSLSGMKDALLYVYGKDHPLYLSSVLSLLQLGRLSTDLVDAWLHIFKANLDGETYIASSAVAVAIFTEDITNCDMSQVDITGAKTVIFPLLMDCHWSLIICDMAAKEVIGLNVMRDMELILLKFVQFLQTCSIDASEWSVTELPHLRQKDDNRNCGVYMLWYVRQFCSGQSLQEGLEVFQERCNIASECIAYSQKGSFGELSITSTDEDLLTNGLVKNYVYYNVQKKVDAVIAVVEGIPPFTVEDFCTIIQEKWFSGSAINFILRALLLTRHEFISVPTLDTLKIFEKNSKLTKTSFLISASFHNKKLILPLNVNKNHWCIIFADTKDKTYTYIDPLKPTEENSNSLHIFLDFLRRRNVVCKEKIDTSGWKQAKYPNLPRQKDGYNCGVFICAYAEAFVRGKLEELVKFECLEKRHQFAKLTVRQAPFCKHLCLYCGKDEFKKSRAKNMAQEMVICEKCKRWAHIHPCLRYLKLKPEAIRSNTFDYTCKICEENGDILTGIILEK